MPHLDFYENMPNMHKNEQASKFIKFIFIFSQLQNLIQDFDYVLYQLYLFQMTIKLDLTCKQ